MKKIKMVYSVNDSVTCDFVKNLRNLREKRKLTLRDVASYTQIPFYIIGRAELGHFRLSIKNLLILADFYGVDLRQSFNFKFFYRRITLKDLKVFFSKNGYSIEELAELTSYSVATLRKLFYQPSDYIYKSHIVYSLYKVMKAEQAYLTGK